MKKIVSYLSLCLILIGAVGFLISMFISVEFIEVKMELPLTRIQGVVEKNNRIYIGLGGYSRIQVYDLNGNYIKYIATHTNGKDYDFKIDDNDIVFAQIAYFRNIITSSYLDNHFILYDIVSQFPHQIICYTHKSSYVFIKQSYLKSYLFDYTIQYMLAVLGVILHILTNKFIFDFMVNKFRYHLKLPLK